MKKVVLCKIFSFFLLSFLILNQGNKSYAESYDDFKEKVGQKFKENVEKENTKKVVIGRFDDGSDFDFSGTICANYSNFAEDRYKHGDFIDAYYFKTKAEKIRRYKIISPANPYSFGILPDDIEQFIIAREQLRNVSINSIVNSNDGLVLADSYIAFDCWLEAFEEGGALERMNRCRNRFIDNIKAMRISLLMQGYNILDVTNKESLILNGRLSTCETCTLYNKGRYCNAIYFNKNSIKIMDKMNIVIKRLEQKLSYFNSPEILILNYSNNNTKSDLQEKRLDAIKNLLYNTISKDLPIKPTIKLTQINLSKEASKNDLYKNAITICISGNE